MTQGFSETRDGAWTEGLPRRAQAGCRLGRGRAAGWMVAPEVLRRIIRRVVVGEQRPALGQSRDLALARVSCSCLQFRQILSYRACLVNRITSRWRTNSIIFCTDEDGDNLDLGMLGRRRRRVTGSGEYGRRGGAATQWMRSCSLLAPPGACGLEPDPGQVRSRSGPAVHPWIIAIVRILAGRPPSVGGFDILDLTCFFLTFSRGNPDLVFRIGRWRRSPLSAMPIIWRWI